MKVTGDRAVGAYTQVEWVRRHCTEKMETSHWYFVINFPFQNKIWAYLIFHDMNYFFKPMSVMWNS